MNIRQKMIGCGAISMLAAALLGNLGYWGQMQLAEALAENQLNISALRNHMEADMMHDALRADVLAAFVVSAGDKTTASQVHTDFKEHSEHFRKMLQDNAALPLTEEIRKAIEQARPALESYISQASQLIERALVDSNAARSLMPAFSASFLELEDKNEALSSLIEAQVSKAQSMGDARVSQGGWWLIAGIIAVCALMALITTELLKSVLGPLDKAVQIARSIAQGSLCNHIRVERNDEAGQLQQALSDMQRNLRQMIDNIRTESERLGLAANTLNHASAAIVHSAVEESDSATSMAAAMEQMIQNISQVAEHANSAKDLSSQSEQLAYSGGQVIMGVVDSMERIAETVNESSSIITTLGQSSEEIHSIIQVIKSIAEQTNLLALNAAIEAARAGEQGRGFAVVADEVRNLAARTAQSTQEITGMIERIRSGTAQAVNSMQTGVERVSDGVSLARQAGDSINEIRGGAHRAAGMVGEISHTIGEQSKASSEVAVRVERIAGMSQENRQTVQELSEAIQLLKSVVSSLQGSVQKFQL